MPRETLTPDDLALAAAGCRALAFRWRQDAQQTTDPILKSRRIEGAEHAERLAEHFDAEREASIVTSRDN